MQKRISNIPFSGTKEQEAQLFEIIEKHKNEPGAIMPVLQEAQNVYGYLPIEVQQMVADGLGVPLFEAEECTEDGKFSLTACRCIGACGLAPVITINDDVYGRLVPEDVKGILAKYE